MTDPHPAVALRAEERQRIHDRHVVQEWCPVDDQYWPCDAVRLLATVAALEQERDILRAERDQWRGEALEWRQYVIEKGWPERRTVLGDDSGPHPD